jgi:hypothetical protein
LRSSSSEPALRRGELEQVARLVDDYERVFVLNEINSRRRHEASDERAK